MFINYIKIAWRNLWRNKLYSSINIGGLALGLAVCMLIMLYVAHEHSYDKFHKNTDRIFSTYTRGAYNGDTINMLYSDYSFAPATAQNDDHITAFLRTFKPFSGPVIVSNTAKTARFSETNLLFADANFFNFFSFKLRSGSAATVLQRPYTVALSQKMAQKYFGTDNPIGKTLTLTTDSSYLFEVSGVMENMPSNSSIQADFVAALSSMSSMNENKTFLTGPNFKTYFLLQHPNDVARVQQNMQLAANKNKADLETRYLLAPLTSLHFEMSSDGGDKYLRIFPFVAGLVLLLALVNYMSLSTARATLRAKEIGIRKVTGATRRVIAGQFYIESALYTLLAFALAYMLYLLLYHWFLNVLQISIDRAFVNGTQALSIMIILLLITTAVAGSYPAMVLSAFKPIATLSGNMSSKSGGARVRKIFTTLQFVIAVTLIISGIVISKQLYYMRHKDTGVNRENILMVSIQKTMGTHYATFKKEVQTLSGVKQAATMRYPMYSSYDMFGGKDENNEPVIFKMLTVDEQFLPLLDIQWKVPPVAATDISQRGHIIVNEALARKLQLPAQPIGKKITADSKDPTIVAGVLKDFHYQSLNNKIDALGLFVGPDSLSFWTAYGCTMYVKVNAKTNLPTLVAGIKNSYERFDKENPFEYQFMDDAFNALFKAEDRLANIFNLFIGLTIFIAGIGLFGLATFAAQQRTKEISIRKVLGASVVNITTLLSKDFIKLVLLSILLAAPIAWWAMHSWLQGFAYAIDLSWWIFALAGLLTIFIAIVTVSFQALKAAVANPVKGL
jgi:putative ABC transport system permease protein